AGLSTGPAARALLIAASPSEHTAQSCCGSGQCIAAYFTLRDVGKRLPGWHWMNIPPDDEAEEQA
ncbi:hypothetical protein, partial [Mesorhizobium sp. M7A.F.Ca.CA.004.11.1.1]|uniref:hypothetical protein n=1 Tax=Mesorhizobium sp. M7A.F.Ca.CA.004.11.1.1 TaxID=2496698 RepID=UPI0019D2E566